MIFKNICQTVATIIIIAGTMTTASFAYADTTEPQKTSSTQNVTIKPADNHLEEYIDVFLPHYSNEDKEIVKRIINQHISASNKNSWDFPRNIMTIANQWKQFESFAGDLSNTRNICGDTIELTVKAVKNGDFDLASEKLDSAIKSMEKLSTSDSRKIMALAYTLKANLSEILLDDEPAITNYKKAIEIANEVDKKATMRYQTKLGHLYYTRDNTIAAVDNLEAAMKTIKDNNIDRHTDGLDTLIDLAIAYEGNFNIEKARIVFDELEPIAEKISESDKEKYLKYITSLSVLRFKEGEYKKFYDMNIKATSLTEQIYSSKHPELAEYYKLRGTYYLFNRDMKQAKECYDRATGVLENIADGINPMLPATLYLVAKFHTYEKNYNKAQEVIDRCIEIHAKLNDTDSSQLAIILAVKGDILRLFDRSIPAITYYEQALAIAKSKTDEKLDMIGSVINNIALIYDNIESYTLAEKYYREALSMVKNNRGENHPDIAICLFNIACMKARQKKFDEITPVMQDVFKIMNYYYKTNEKEHGATISIVRSYYSILVDSGKSIEEIKIIFQDLGLTRFDVDNIDSYEVIPN